MRDCAERKNILPIAADFVGATPRGRPETCASVTFHPMRGCAEWKNLLPSAADVVGAGSIPPGGILRWRFARTLPYDVRDASHIFVICG